MTTRTWQEKIVQQRTKYQFAHRASLSSAIIGRGIWVSIALDILGAQAFSTSPQASRSQAEDPGGKSKKTAGRTMKPGAGYTK